jgi:hypothetical protein
MLRRIAKCLSAVAVALTDDLPIVVGQLFETALQSIAARFEQIDTVDGVTREKFHRGIAQLGPDFPLLSSEPVHLIMGDYADPFDEVRTQFKGVTLAPQHNADLLKDLFRMGRASEQRHQIGKEPTVVLGKKTGKRIATLSAIGRKPTFGCMRKAACHKQSSHLYRHPHQLK